MAPVPRSTTRLDPEVRRELILDAAERVLVGHPQPADITFEEIAEAAAVSRGLLYNYFDDRTGLLVALARRTLDHLDRELAAALDAGTDPGSQVAALGRAYARYVRAHAGTWTMLSRSGLLDHPVVLAARRDRIARVARLWGDTPDARLAAWIVTALFEVAGVSPLPEPTTGEDLVRVLRHLVAPDPDAGRGGR